MSLALECTNADVKLTVCHSRNVLLSEKDAKRAPCIYKALQWAQQAAAGGKVGTATSIQHEVYARMKAGGGEPEYVEVRFTLNPKP